MNGLAKTISFLFHPIFLPIYCAAIIINANPSIFGYMPSGPEKLMIILFFNMVVLPGIIILMMIPLGFVRNIYIEDRQERILPYVATIFFYIWTFILLYKENLSPDYITVIVLGALIGVILSFLTNILYMKVSIHTVGMGLMIGFILAMVPLSEKNLIPVLFSAVVIAGLVGTARLIMKSHKPKEVYTGYFIGLFSQLLALMIIF